MWNITFKNCESLSCTSETFTVLYINYQFSCSVVSNSLKPQGLQYSRLPCPSPTPGAYSNSCPSESVMPSNHQILCHPLLLLPSVFPSIRGFSSESTRHITWPIIGVSASASVLPVKIQDWYPLGLTCPCSPRDSRVFSNTTVQKHQFFGAQPSSQFNSHIHT